MPPIVPASPASAFTPAVYPIQLPEASGSGDGLIVHIVAVPLAELLELLGAVPGLGGEPDQTEGRIANQNLAAILKRVQDATRVEHAVLMRAMVAPKLKAFDDREVGGDAIPIDALSVWNRKFVLEQIIAVSGLSSGKGAGSDAAVNAADNLARFSGEDVEGPGGGSGSDRDSGSDASPGA